MFEAGGFGALLLSLALILKAHNARTDNFKRTEVWIMLEKNERPPEALAADWITHGAQGRAAVLGSPDGLGGARDAELRAAADSHALNREAATLEGLPGARDMVKEGLARRPPCVWSPSDVACLSSAVLSLIALTSAGATAQADFRGRVAPGQGAFAAAPAKPLAPAVREAAATVWLARPWAAS